MKYILFLLTAFVSTAFADGHQATMCTHGDNERKIEVVYPEGTKVPCEVQYTKNGDMQVLWDAQGETGYCEQKAADLVEKQQGWGWQCDAMEQASSEEAMEEVSSDGTMEDMGSEEVMEEAMDQMGSEEVMEEAMDQMGTEDAAY